MTQETKNFIVDNISEQEFLYMKVEGSDLEVPFKIDDDNEVLNQAIIALTGVAVEINGSFSSSDNGDGNLFYSGTKELVFQSETPIPHLTVHTYGVHKLEVIEYDANPYTSNGVVFDVDGTQEDYEDGQRSIGGEFADVVCILSENGGQSNNFYSYFPQGTNPPQPTATGTGATATVLYAPNSQRENLFINDIVKGGQFASGFTNQKYRLTLNGNDSGDVFVKVISGLQYLPISLEFINDDTSIVVPIDGEKINLTLKQPNIVEFEFVEESSGAPKLLTAQQVPYFPEYIDEEDEIPTQQFGGYKFEEVQRGGIKQFNSGFGTKASGVNISEISTSQYINPMAPYNEVFNVTPVDLDEDNQQFNLTRPSRAIMVDESGNVNLLTSSGGYNIYSFAMLAGVEYKIQAVHIFNSGTTASGIKALN